MNVHDELMCGTHPSIVKQVTATVRRVVESYRDKVPLIGSRFSPMPEGD